MIRLITLEIKRCRLTTYHRAASIGGITMLGFLYFMAAIPWIDPTDTDIELFASYDFLFNLEHLLSMAIFSIMGAVMGPGLSWKNTLVRGLFCSFLIQ